MQQNFEGPEGGNYEISFPQRDKGESGSGQRSAEALWRRGTVGELKTSSPAQRHSSSMGCKPSSAADYDHSVAHSKLSGAPRAHLLPVKRKSFQFSSISERRK